MKKIDVFIIICLFISSNNLFSSQNTLEKSMRCCVCHPSTPWPGMPSMDLPVVAVSAVKNSSPIVACLKIENRTPYLIDIYSNDEKKSGIGRHVEDGSAYVANDFTFKVINPSQRIYSGNISVSQDILLLTRQLRCNSEMRNRKHLVVFEANNDLLWTFY